MKSSPRHVGDSSPSNPSIISVKAVPMWVVNHWTHRAPHRNHSHYRRNLPSRVGPLWLDPRSYRHHSKSTPINIALLDWISTYLNWPRRIWKCRASNNSRMRRSVWRMSWNPTMLPSRAYLGGFHNAMRKNLCVHSTSTTRNLNNTSIRLLHSLFRHHSPSNQEFKSRLVCLLPYCSIDE